jgi:hypothetical protein
MDYCPHADAKSMVKIREEIGELGRLLGYRTFRQAYAMGFIKQARAALAKAKGGQALTMISACRLSGYVVSTHCG